MAVYDVALYLRIQFALLGIEAHLGLLLLCPCMCLYFDDMCIMFKCNAYSIDALSGDNS